MAAAANPNYKSDVERAAERAIKRPVVLDGKAPPQAVASPALELQNRLSVELEDSRQEVEKLQTRFLQTMKFAAYTLTIWCVGFILYSLL
ncbi:MAG: hypothetical protein AAF950_08040 [Pseudomonadota bacterium]